MPEPRGIVFDLDDTLYPYRAFVRSGLRVIGQQIAREYAVSTSLIARALRRAAIDGVRGREVQALCASLALPASIVPSLVAILRDHSPSLRLPCESRRVLTTLRGGWKIGILTNGTPEIQRRKLAALGVPPLVDAVVIATEVGDRRGKPSPTAFRAALDRLGLAPERTVFVGDDEQADIAGAAAAGMQTIHVLAQRPPAPTCGSARCAAHVRSIGDVPVNCEWARASEDGVSCRLRLVDCGSASASRCS